MNLFIIALFFFLSLAAAFPNEPNLRGGMSFNYLPQPFLQCKNECLQEEPLARPRQKCVKRCISIYGHPPLTDKQECIHDCRASDLSTVDKRACKMNCRDDQNQSLINVTDEH